jgi:hypothetical protein
MATQSKPLDYAEEHLRELARKSLVAEDKLAAMFETIAGIAPDKARDLVAFYIRKKMVKLDLCNARYTVTHGRYLDADFIEHLALHGAF